MGAIQCIRLFSLGVLNLIFILPTSLAAGYMKSIRLPLSSDFSSLDERMLLAKFSDYVQSAGYLEACPKIRGKFLVPAFGKHASIRLGPAPPNQQQQQQTQEEGNPKQRFQQFQQQPLGGTTATCTEYVLSGEGMSKHDFGWICAYLMRNPEMFGQHVDTSRLEQVCTKFNTLEPTYVGVKAPRGNPTVANILSPQLLQELKNRGFIVMDTNITTCKESNDLLSEVLTSKSTQPKQIRSDSVKFLDQQAADDCGLEHQFNLLMGIAGYLNEHLDHEDFTTYEPIEPATLVDPLTNPSQVQAAEYRRGEYYLAHSDNGLYDDGLRLSHRRYTAILYCNEDYCHGDGGSLRLYLKSGNAPLNSAHAYDTLHQHEIIDIEPVNGRLLIFDSRLLHAVTEVEQDEYPRQALTVWINQPQDRPLYGDILHDKK